MKKWILRIGLPLLFVGFLILLVAGTESTGSNPLVANDGQRVPSRLSGPAPDFNLQSLDGDTINLASYRGEKAVVLDFWASWCPNCRRDMPILHDLYQQYQDQVEVIAVNLQESESAARDYIEGEGFTFPAVLDPNGQTARDYLVTYTNTHVLIDKDGNVVQAFSGDISESHFEELIEEPVESS